MTPPMQSTESLMQHPVLAQRLQQAQSAQLANPVVYGLFGLAWQLF